tara:strand:+ start:97 stop:723 length:627 start_codon:yes stop_codon:yes gene_type:complete
MNLQNYYWFFPSVIPSRICDEIVKTGESFTKQKGLTGGNLRKDTPPSEEELKNIQKKRKSDVVWLSGQWIYKELHPFLQIANERANWNFQWDWSESCQYTEYKEGQFYDWHCDSNPVPYDKPDDPNTNGKIRKLSMTLCLSDPEDYEGGDLEFAFHDQDGDKQPKICEEIRPRGSLIIFPSFVWHRVKPVTKGIRHSLVCWSLGQPYV